MTIFFISDTHFGHANILTFTRDNGTTKVRPEFATVEEMDETMIARWNARVRPTDHVYHCGDVAMYRPSLLKVMPRLRGHKRLIRGNHDIFPTKNYLKFFDEIHGCRVFGRTLFTHIPIHPASLGRFDANVHGHIHEREEYGPRYLNISVERIGYQPVSLEEIREQIAIRTQGEPSTPPALLTARSAVAAER